MFAAIAAPPTESDGFPTSRNCNASFTSTAASMESAAHFALPRPVRQAARVSTDAIRTAETDISRTSEIKVSVSPEPRDGYKSRTIGRAKANSPAAQGRQSNMVSPNAYSARVLPSSLSPRATA